MFGIYSCQYPSCPPQPTPTPLLSPFPNLEEATSSLGRAGLPSTLLAFLSLKGIREPACSVCTLPECHETGPYYCHPSQQVAPALDFGTARKGVRGQVTSVITAPFEQMNPLALGRGVAQGLHCSEHPSPHGLTRV